MPISAINPESRKTTYDRIREILILGTFGSKTLRSELKRPDDFEERARQAYLNDALFHHAVDYQLSAIMTIIEDDLQIKIAAQTVVKHWDEFGPKADFEREIDYLRKLLEK